jgi:predicted ATPase
MKIAVFGSPQFQHHINSLAQQTLPVKTAFKFKKMFKVIDEELKTLEEVKKGLVEKFGERTEEGALKEDENGSVKLDLAKRSEWEPEVLDMQNIESALEPVLVEDLGDKVEISTAALLFLVEVGFLKE